MRYKTKNRKNAWIGFAVESQPLALASAGCNFIKKIIFLILFFKTVITVISLLKKYKEITYSERYRKFWYKTIIRLNIIKKYPSDKKFIPLIYNEYINIIKDKNFSH